MSSQQSLRHRMTAVKHTHDTRAYNSYKLYTNKKITKKNHPKIGLRVYTINTQQQLTNTDSLHRVE